jgi:hypothetical protein
MIRLRFGFVLLAGSSFGLALGCNDGDGNGNGQLASAYLDKLQACGLLSEGELPAVDADDVDASVACYLDCLLDATCVEVQALTCDPASVMPSAQLVACYEACEALNVDDDFMCGDGSTLPPSWVCDGAPDCADSTDEVDCVPFDCGDGGMLTESLVCDGWADCMNGSDELDCPGYVMCADGTGSYNEEEDHCDGQSQCGDGSDELGCPTYECANGEKAVAGIRCNFNEDCEDGSDEAGCAQLLCPNP